MKKKIIIPIICVVLVAAIALPIILSTMNGSKKADAIVIMTEELSDLFSPFYATTGADQDVVGMTQMGMLTSKYDSKTKETNIVAGKDYATVALAYDISSDGLTYTFVLKNGLKFSDGHPLTMNDVMFNLYEYLDPVYTGSSTMYSTKIKGLSEYRTKNNSDENAESAMEETAQSYADGRIEAIKEAFLEVATDSEDDSIIHETDETAFKNYINNEWEPTISYKKAVQIKDENDNVVASPTTDDYRAKMIEDYEYILKAFKKELEDDYNSAKDAFDLETDPYKKWADTDHFGNDTFKFFYYEGLIYASEYAKNDQNKDDKSNILKFTNDDLAKRYPTREQAISHVYNTTLKSKFHSTILSASATYGTVRVQFAADAKSKLLQDAASDSEGKFENISGIVSLGHTTDVSSVTVDGNTYKVAHEYNGDGTVKNSGEYAVLQITLEELDPKAIYNFSFSVSPVHYYTASTMDDYIAGNYEKVDIKNNKFGVKYADSDFQSKVIQSSKNVSIPMGAGVYSATDASDSDIENVTANGFKNSGIVYFKKNSNFVFEVKHERMRMQVVSSSGALDVLKKGTVHYVTPQLTKTNLETVQKLKGIGYSTVDQLGYGYIGINAGKVPNIYVRKAIMSAMNTALATEYYSTGTCSTIHWPMSKVSWAYPYVTGTENEASTGLDYVEWTDENGKTDDAKAEILKYTKLAKENSDGVAFSEDMLKITFTIAGASITEHPTYQVFKQAADLLNSIEDEGWNVEVKADSQALTKLSTGSLAVWAAAWGSTIDPDMYQVYHINSSATSTYSWGYREIKASPSTYPIEYGIISGELKTLIEQGRSTSDQNTRKGIYKEAMELVLELAVELPVYQRQNLYAYNTTAVKGFYTDVNPYESPLNEMWNLELVG